MSFVDGGTFGSMNLTHACIRNFTSYLHANNVCCNTECLLVCDSASGSLCLWPSLFACSAMILSILACARCSLVKPLVFSLYDIFPNAANSIGLWCYETNNGYFYDARNYTFDPKFQAARGLGATVMGLGFAILVFYGVAGFRRFSGNVFKAVGLLAMLNGLFQGLVFLMYRSDICAGGCNLGTGGKCGVCACIFWFITGALSVAVGVKEP